MRKGFNPAILLAPNGALFALATGSDATAEHEGGVDPLVTELTGEAPYKSDQVAKDLKAGRIKAIPDFVNGRVIVRDLEHIQFVRGEDRGEPVAAIGYNVRGYEMALLTSPELTFNAFSEPKNIVGAWDDSSFGFKVKGKELADKLEGFHAALQQGHGMFAGTFLSDQEGARLRGLILCDTRYLTSEHREAMTKAQVEFESLVDLHLRSRADEILAKARQVFSSGHRNFGHVWTVRPAEGSSEVRYGYNPGYGVPSQYYGHYTFEELMSWLDSGALTPLSHR